MSHKITTYSVGPLAKQEILKGGGGHNIFNRIFFGRTNLRMIEKQGKL